MSAPDTRNVRQRTDESRLPLSLYKEDPSRDPKRIQRMRVLGDTVARLSEPARRAELRELADANAKRAKTKAPKNEAQPLRVILREADTLDMAKSLFEEHGELPVVLNMACATRPGGGYRSGSAAQEENLFRRTDLHFRFKPGQVVKDYSKGKDVYSEDMEDLINGTHGLVYMDTDPCICIRGSENFDSPTLGYFAYEDHEIFSFYELRSAAWVARGSDDERQRPEAARRIRAQFETLVAESKRVLVLSAFGCGAFGNDATVVAEEYAKAILEYKDRFSVIAFAIYYAGWGASNFDVFKAVFLDKLASLQGKLEID